MDHIQASVMDYAFVARFLETDLTNGLSQTDVQARLKHFGRNTLGDDQTSFLPKHIESWILQFLSPLVQLLLICALISALIGQYEGCTSILVSILIVCMVSYIQQRLANERLAKMNSLVAAKCNVIRDGKTQEIDTDQLVPGDIVHLVEGQRAPADIRLFRMYSVAVCETIQVERIESQCKQIELANMSASSMSSESTGSSLEFTGALMTLDVGASELLRRDAKHTAGLKHLNLALMGTLVEAGYLYGIVIATGKSTHLGQVYSVLSLSHHPDSPMRANIDQLSLQLVVIACLIIAPVAIVAIVQLRSPLDVASFAISLAVIVIPEGLPTVVAVALKEIVDSTLEQDNLPNLMNTVTEGKTIRHKINSFITYHISISLSVIVLIVISFANKTDAPFSIVHLLYINILADGPLAQSLAMEQPNEDELCAQFSCRLVGIVLVLTGTLIGLNGGLYNFLLDSDGTLDGRGRALMFASFVFCATFAALSLRSKFKTIFETRIYGNRALLCCCSLVILLQLAITQISPIACLFQMDPVPYIELLYVFLYSSITLIMMDSLKLFKRFLDFSRRLLIKAIHKLKVPSTSRNKTYSTHNGLNKSNRFANNADYLAAIRPSITTQCTAVTRRSAPRTLFGNLMPANAVMHQDVPESTR